MKKIVLFAVLALVSMNLLAGNMVGKKWNKKGPKENIKIDPVSQTITMKNDGTAKFFGVLQFVVLNQQTAAPLRFSCESKAVNVSGDSAYNYCVYLDLTLQDGTRDYGKVISFSTGTHDWEKKEMTYTPKKAVKSVDFYLLFRSMKGEVSFRNYQLEEVK